MKALCNYLREEYAALDRFVSALSPAQWQTETAFFGWSVCDEIAHIAFIDGHALLAFTDAVTLDQEVKIVSAELDRGGSMPRLVHRLVGGPLEPPALLARWRDTRTRLLEQFAGADPKARFPWYGPPMGVRSFATARLMETWAHGQDVYDALGRTRINTDRLRHIAHLGVATLGWSFQNRGLAVPDVPVRVELAAPSGTLWEWGEPGAADRVTGAAEDFCLAVTRRRRLADTALACAGETARRWMEVAQCFAGPPIDAPSRAGCR